MTSKKPIISSNEVDLFYLEEVDHKKMLRKFLQLNSLRLQRTKDSLKQRHVDFLQFLPLIFHINHPLLPGFVSTQCPAGIPKFNPDKDAIRYARCLAKSFEYKRRAYRQYDIHALYIMGSTGTIAYSDKSDFDVWVCHRENLSPIELKELQLKSKRISQWCAELNLEVNFFLMNTENFRQGKIDTLSTESSGSTQHLLLLEEFYRTSILLAGRYPIWWLVPPKFEKDYDSYVQNIIHRRLLNEHDFLNFGPIDNIPAEEFYGATLWHIYKGIDSPYKSILKLLLMECYAKEHPDIDLLSLRFKRAVYSGTLTSASPLVSEAKRQNKKGAPDKLDLDKLDPYIMMMEKISEHLVMENSSNRLELARQCLYLKVNALLSHKKSPSANVWRQQIMLKLVNSWQWQRPKLILLDSRKHWKINTVLEEHKNIIEALTFSYRKLSDFFRYQNKGVRISKRDLHILGRKLYAAFEKKAGKIEIISHDNEINLFEPQVSLHPIFQKTKASENKEQGWALYIGAINTINKKTPAPVKKSTQLLKLLCWGYFNHVISTRTSFVLAKEIPVLSIREIKQIIEALDQTYSNSTPGYASMEDLIKPAQLDLNILFLNIGIDPFLSKHPKGTQIATKLTDALNFSGRHENLLMTIDQVLLTTWREVIINHFSEENGLMECLCQYLKWNHESAQDSFLSKRPTLVCCFSSVRGEAISRRIKQLFNDVIDIFHSNDRAYNSRYLLAIEESFYLIWQEDDTGPKYQKIPDQKELFRELSYPLAKFNSLIIDQEFCENKILKLIFSANKKNHIQLFYQNHRKTADIYIIDERGSLYHQITTIEKNNIHINHFILFLDSVLNRLSFSNAFSSNIDESLPLFEPLEKSLLVSLDDHNFTNDGLEDSESELQLEVFEIQKQPPGQLLLEEQFSRLQSMPTEFFKIQVIADLNADGTRQYSIYANNKEFSSFELGKNFYLKVAQEVFSTRQHKQRYPIYITDIDLSPALRDSESSHGVQATQLLKFKQEIERRLNLAIKKL